jgi:hypothetical protein
LTQNWPFLGVQKSVSPWPTEKWPKIDPEIDPKIDPEIDPQDDLL